MQTHCVSAIAGHLVRAGSPLSRAFREDVRQKGPDFCVDAEVQGRSQKSASGTLCVGRGFATFCATSPGSEACGTGAQRKGRLARMSASAEVGHRDSTSGRAGWRGCRHPGPSEKAGWRGCRHLRMLGIGLRPAGGHAGADVGIRGCRPSGSAVRGSLSPGIRGPMGRGTRRDADVGRPVRISAAGA